MVNTHKNRHLKEIMSPEIELKFMRCGPFRLSLYFTDAVMSTKHPPEIQGRVI